MTQAGRHFLQVPGPTNVPDRVLRAMAMPTIDHRGPEFAALARGVLAEIGQLCGTAGHVVMYPSSGTGAWEAALVNTLSPGDRILAFDNGYFAASWARMAGRFGIEVDLVPGDWRHGVTPESVHERLAADHQHRVKAVTVVHNETSTGVLSRIEAIRTAMDAAAHPALLLVDAVSSLASVDYRHDEWRVDVTVWSSQKGMMLPPGLGFLAVSPKAVAASERARLPKSYWDWRPHLEVAGSGAFPYTPPTNLLYALRAALDMFQGEGLPNVFARHRRNGLATRRAVAAWGLQPVCVDPREHSPILTAVLVDGDRAELVRQLALERFNLSLGSGLGQLAGRCFRIGHLGDLGPLGLAGTLAGVQMALRLAGVPMATGGVDAALAVLGAAETDTEL